MSHAIALTGVVDDGSPLDDAVPGDTAQTIQIVRGGTCQISVKLVTRSAVPVDLRDFTSWTGKLTVRETNSPARSSIVKTWLAAQPALTHDTLLFSLVTTDTRYWETGRYWYDIWLAGNSSSWQVVAPGAFILLPSLIA